MRVREGRGAVEWAKVTCCHDRAFVPAHIHRIPTPWLPTTDSQMRHQRRRGLTRLPQNCTVPRPAVIP